MESKSNLTISPFTPINSPRSSSVTSQDRFKTPTMESRLRVSSFTQINNPSSSPVADPATRSPTTKVPNDDPREETPSPEPEDPTAQYTDEDIEAANILLSLSRSTDTIGYDVQAIRTRGIDNVSPQVIYRLAGRYLNSEIRDWSNEAIQANPSAFPAGQKLLGTQHVSNRIGYQLRKLAEERGIKYQAIREELEATRKVTGHTKRQADAKTATFKATWANKWKDESRNSAPSRKRMPMPASVGDVSPSVDGEDGVVRNKEQEQEQGSEEMDLDED